MKRPEFIEILKKAAPALSAKDLVPSFSCFFFKDGKVQAYDDVVAIETPCDIITGDVDGDSAKVVGGLRGKLLMDYLGASRSPEIEFKVDGTTCTVKTGRGKLALPLLPMEDFMFEWPVDADEVPLTVTDTFMEAIRACYASIGLDPSVPWRMGITIVFGKKTVTLYSSDNYTLTRSTAEVVGPNGLATILPPKFCELILAKGKPETMIITQISVEARYDDGTRIFSRTLAEVKPEGFSGIMDSLGWDDGYVAIPKGLDGSLDRALVVLDGADDQHSEITVTPEIEGNPGSGRLKMFSKGPVGEARDMMKFPDTTAAVVKVRAALLKRPLPHASGMRVIEGKCVAFVGPNFRHMVSVST